MINLDFGSLGSAKGHFRELDFWTGRMLGLADVRSCLLVRTYAIVCSADVWWSPTERPLTDSTPYSVNSITDVCPKVPGVRYFLEYHPVNTWIYETAFGPVCNSTGRTPLWTRRPLLFGPINTPSPLAHITPNPPFNPFLRPSGYLLAICEYL
jgi:hypothetical protein